MEKRSIYICGVFLSLLVSSLRSEIEFSDQSSQLEISADSYFYINSQGLSIDGTLKHNSGGAQAVLAGTDPQFSQGVLERDNKKTNITAQYNGASGAHIILNGGKIFEAVDRDFTPDSITISGAGNKIEGIPNIPHQLSVGSGDELILALDHRLNQNISLTSGTLTLQKDLYFEQQQQQNVHG